MSDFTDRCAACPFFKKAYPRDKRICCEGLTEDSKIILQYQKELSWQIQVRSFCCGKYQNCEIYTAIKTANYLE